MLSWVEVEPDTIFALSSAPGRAGVAVVRISGPQAVVILDKITKSALPDPRVLVVRELIADAELIDKAMVVWFQEGRSFTSELVVELHLHGGRATVASILNLLSDFENTRAAAPGEFTRRALENGRMDLVSVEALADLIDAETDEQRKQALNLMNGAGGREARKWRQDLVRALALLEASIDFADEDDAPEDVSDEVAEIVSDLRAQMMEAIEGSKAAARVRDGFRIALVGAPNAGKSTLMNALARRDASIISPIAGTTRDIIEVAADFGGYPVILLDTAGLRETTDLVESIGVERALKAAKEADIRLFLGTEDAPWIEATDLFVEGDIRVWTKSDLYKAPSGLPLSAISGDGLIDLISAVMEKIGSAERGNAVFARQRQVACLARCVDQLEFCVGVMEPELRVEHLRSGVDAMNELFGDASANEILGEIFSTFCIGK